MKAKILTAGAIAVILAIGSAIAWSEFRSAREADAELAALAKRNADMAAGLNQAKKEIAEAARNRAALQKTVNEIVRAAAVASAAEGAGSKRHRDALDLLASDPKLYALGAKAFRSGMIFIYGPFFRAANLSPEQIDKFESLVLQHQEQLGDIILTARDEGLAPNDPAIATLVQQENQQFRGAESDLLGDQGYQQLQQSMRMAPVQGIVNQVATSVSLSSPLSGAQADQLTQILANASSRYQTGGPATQNTVNWDAALGQAQSVLSPAQFSALQARYNQIQINQFRGQFTQQEFGGN